MVSRLAPGRAALCFGLAGSIAGFAPGAARAALGGDLASVERDHAAMTGAVRAITPTVSYDIHALTAPNGDRVREYLDRTGRVFAVTAAGQRRPDLERLLGAYAERYAAAARAQSGPRRTLAVSTPDFVLSVVRLPRGWQARAYLPGALPAGVGREELR
jgi:hypothetical protein